MGFSRWWSLVGLPWALAVRTSLKTWVHGGPDDCIARWAPCPRTSSDSTSRRARPLSHRE
jgi:hypothetical protein